MFWIAAVPGGWGPWNAAGNGEMQAIVDELKAEVERRNDAVFDSLQAIEYASQVVAGMNYLIKVSARLDKVDSEVVYLQLSVFQDLDGNLILTGADPIGKF